MVVVVATFDKAGSYSNTMGGGNAPSLRFSPAIKELEEDQVMCQRLPRREEYGGM